MQFRRRSSNLNDEDAINEILRKDSFTRKKTKFTDFIFSSLIYIVLIPTLIYNVVWYFYLKNSLLFLNNEEALGESNIQGCSDVYHWVNYSLTWTLVCFLKALFLLLCYSVCCGGENDCTIVCVIFKSLTSLIPSLFYIVKIPEYVNNYKVYTANAIKLTGENEFVKAGCDNMADTLISYYRWEYAYLIFALSMFCFVPLGAVFMCLKECWKGRNYAKED